MAKFLFFAGVREKMGQPALEQSIPGDVTTVGALMVHLRGLGDPWAAALTGGHLRVAVNQNHARDDDPVSDGDEIAIFPPVSGG